MSVSAATQRVGCDLRCKRMQVQRSASHTDVTDGDED